eukprot:6178364-Pleurochrysis_carterae.AAC.2
MASSPETSNTLFLGGTFRRAEKISSVYYERRHIQRMKSIDPPSLYAGMKATLHKKHAFALLLAV